MSDLSTDSVGIIICAKDASATIARAIRSALAQPEAAEVIVFDDQSSDDTVAVARGCDDGSGRLTILTSAVNLGPAGARNRAIATSQAPLICVLDADDYMQPGRLGALLAEPAGWDMLADDMDFAAEGSEDMIYDHLLGAGVTTPREVGLAEFVHSCLNDPARPRRELAFIKPLMRRVFLEAHGLAYDETLRLGEDFILYANALADGARLRLVSAKGYVAVERTGSLSGQHRTADFGAFLTAARKLAARANLSQDSRTALATHFRGLKRNHDFRVALDRKASGDIAGAISGLIRAPDSAFYATREILKARLRPRT